MWSIFPLPTERANNPRSLRLRRADFGLGGDAFLDKSSPGWACLDPALWGREGRRRSALQAAARASSGTAAAATDAARDAWPHRGTRAVELGVEDGVVH